MPLDPSQSPSARPQAGPERAGPQPETDPESELADRDDGLDPDDAYRSLDEADQPVWDAWARGIDT